MTKYEQGKNNKTLISPDEPKNNKSARTWKEKSVVFTGQIPDVLKYIGEIELKKSSVMDIGFKYQNSTYDRLVEYDLVAGKIIPKNTINWSEPDASDRWEKRKNIVNILTASICQRGVDICLKEKIFDDIEFIYAKTTNYQRVTLPDEVSISYMREKKDRQNKRYAISNKSNYFINRIHKAVGVDKYSMSNYVFFRGLDGYVADECSVRNEIDVFVKLFNVYIKTRKEIMEIIGENNGAEYGAYYTKHR
jgi:hypothetical protein